MIHKKEIQTAIKNFSLKDISTSSMDFFASLGYTSNKELDYSLTDMQYIFQEKYSKDADNILERAIFSEWQDLKFLFQYTADEVLQQSSLFQSKFKPDEYESYLFLCISLSESEYSRTKLSTITREVNKLFAMPVMILFAYGEKLTLSIINRRPNKLDSSKNVFEKVTFIKDINSKNPHRAHIEILFDLSFSEIQNNYQPKNFNEFHNGWQAVLNIKELNKRFYKELSDWYFWAMREVFFPSAPIEAEFGKDALNVPAVREHNAKNLIRLLTRVLFVWFVKEKGLIPEELFDKDYIQENLLKDFLPKKFHQKTQSSSYYRAVLQNLFFATLNQDKKREFRNPKQHMNVTNLMRYKSYFKDSDSFLKMVDKIVPFMNGGLFECLDKPHETVKGKRGGDKIIYIDGFSDRDDNRLMVPDHIFFGYKDHVNLSDDYGQGKSKNKDVIVRGLIDILHSFKFTIAENTPIEEDIALDPELLGQVFENLLASYNPETKTTARKQTGSFYTPREIVDYMVDESLIAHLKNVFKASSFENNVTKASSFENNVAKASSFENNVAKASSFENNVTKASSFENNVTKASSFENNFQSKTQSKDALDTLDSQSKDALDTFLDPNGEVDIKRGMLPHWKQSDVWYFVTFRLADSVPKDKVEELKKSRENWLKKHKDKKEYSKEEWREYNRLFNERIETWMNAGYGSCLLKKEKNAKFVADALKKFEGERYELDEWVVMPNHVHVLVKPIKDFDLSDILHSWKSYTANIINKNENKTGQLWMHESYDHIVRNEKALYAIRKYIRENPKKANIVAKASSFEYNVTKASSFENNVAKASSFENNFQSKTQSKDALDTLDSQSRDALDTMLHQLLSYDETQPFTEDEHKVLIIQALDNCKILDPACGSGAFPMGVLHKMVHILHKIDPGNEKWKNRQLEKVEAIDDSAIREKAIQDIEEAFENNDLDYGRKLYLIENCIYGVDIQPIAVQISKLRFFISLIVDQNINKRKNNLGVRPLPNLETKFVAANTLIGIEKPEGHLFEDRDVKKLEVELKKVRHRLFSAKTQATKKKLRNDDKKLREKISEKLIANGWGNETAKQLASWDPYDQNATSPFFDSEWMFDVSTGFDVVIGNPPYVQLQKDGGKLAKMYVNEGYETFARTGDIYSLFYEMGIWMLSKNGVLCYITSNSWMRTGYGKPLRKFFVENTIPLKILNFVDTQLFEAAIVEANILLLQNNSYQGIQSKNAMENFYGVTIEQNDTGTIEQIFKENSISLKFLSDKEWNVGDEETNTIKEKMEKNGILIKDLDIKINYGIKTGYNDAFWINKEIKNNIISKDKKSSSIIKPFLRGKDINRYSYTFKDTYLIYSHSSVNKKDFPSIIQHLKKFKNKLINRKGGANSKGIVPYEWWQLQVDYYNSGTYKNFTKEKLIWMELCDEPKFAYDINGYFPDKRCWVMVGKNIKYYLSILNSKCSNWYMLRIANTTGMGTIQWQKVTLQFFPIPKAPIDSPKLQEPLVALVDKILAAKDPEKGGRYDADTSEWEEEIDARVFHLYRLTEEEMLVVLDSFPKMSGEEKEKIVEFYKKLR